jgi:hypothetical protein
MMRGIYLSAYVVLVWLSPDTLPANMALCFAVCQEYAELWRSCLSYLSMTEELIILPTTLEVLGRLHKVAVRMVLRE